MTVVKLKGGGLWVHSAVAPTSECMEALQALVEDHGAVKYIINPTYAVEHKTYVGALAAKFPEAQLWVVPGQWSYPINFPIRFAPIYTSSNLFLYLFVGSLNLLLNLFAASLYLDVHLFAASANLFLHLFAASLYLFAASLCLYLHFFAASLYLFLHLFVASLNLFAASLCLYLHFFAASLYLFLHLFAASLYIFAASLRPLWQLGQPLRKIYTLSDGDPPPWGDEIEQATLGPLQLQVGMAWGNEIEASHALAAAGW
eukprot:gene6080-2681_t